MLIKTENQVIMPPGDDQVEITETEASGEIYVDHLFINAPLIPHVIARKDEDRISVNALVFIDTEKENPEFKVSKLLSVNIDGTYQMQFFIHCDLQEDLKWKEEETRQLFKAYTIKFNTTIEQIEFPLGVKLEHIQTIQTFLWDIDPETSRGTETVVLSTE